jgi:hypothetical protein
VADNPAVDVVGRSAMFLGIRGKRKKSVVREAWKIGELTNSAEDR